MIDLVCFRDKMKIAKVSLINIKLLELEWRYILWETLTALAVCFSIVEKHTIDKSSDKSLRSPLLLNASHIFQCKIVSVSKGFQGHSYLSLPLSAAG